MGGFASVVFAGSKYWPSIEKAQDGARRKQRIKAQGIGPLKNMAVKKA